MIKIDCVKGYVDVPSQGVELRGEMREGVYIRTRSCFDKTMSDSIRIHAMRVNYSKVSYDKD